MGAARPGERHVRIEEARAAHRGRGAARARHADAHPRHPLRQRPARCAPPYPEGTETMVVGMGCFWGAERAFWSMPGVWVTAVGYAGGHHAQPDLRGGVLGPHGSHRGRAGGVRSRRRSATTPCSRCSGSITTPPRACGRATTWARSTARPSTPTSAAQLEAAERSAAAFGERLAAAGYGADHHRDRRGLDLLLRRGLPPAVPGQEPERLLRAGRHRRLLPDRAGHRRVSPAGRSRPLLGASPRSLSRRSGGRRG